MDNVLICNQINNIIISYKIILEIFYQMFNFDYKYFLFIISINLIIQKYI